MKIVKLTQGTPEWHAHRSAHFNASDAPAMLGLSPYESRSELIKRLATGIEREITPQLQRIFDEGHRIEALCRPLAEQVIGEDLFPCVGTEGRLSASFDGLTMMEDAIWEHKTLNMALRSAIPRKHVADGHIPLHGDEVVLPEIYCAQLEQQMMVSGADRALFMATSWDGDIQSDSRGCWYLSDPALRARIVAGWAQLEQDISAYQPEQEVAPAPVGKAPDQLPALHVAVSGMVTASNLDAFKTHAMAVFGGINRDLQTDEDFADARKTITWAKGVEDRLESVKSAALADAAPVEAVFRAMDELKEEARRIRLDLEKCVKARDISIRQEIVDAGIRAARAHYEQLVVSLGEFAPRPDQATLAGIGASIKGKRSISSMRDAVSTAVADIKIAASQRAETIRANVSILKNQHQHQSLFADRVMLAQTKSPEDLRNLVAARIGEFERQETERLERQREQIRKEEAEKLSREQDAAKVVDETPPASAKVVQSAPQAQSHFAASTDEIPAKAEKVAQPAGPAKTIKLGDISALIAPLSITADGLAQLGFNPAGTDRAAKLYREDQVLDMLRAMMARIKDVGLGLTERKAA
ncbi:YqaJ viral recombinase family protein [Frateuria aurantia]|uniref:Phage-related protein, predicted endonuclease n=1 Tax=Frateuria aurantia (strain ATCC 33424 / DSM 6220 / KCTC 2777 / LMG 1558 / NBRC 3245 / NCIMB 13370) TaxID=767434 RepID=H8L633_FRAAD|nr:YqaJ viral recombinase family protein [Frateuria aurantia]AFC85877.1 phage-related protein, predicted endonuclease [Frateuria aurantia DSM 6220]